MNACSGCKRMIQLVCHDSGGRKPLQENGFQYLRRVTAPHGCDCQCITDVLSSRGFCTEFHNYWHAYADPSHQ